MLSPEKRALLAELSRSSHGEALREYLEECYEEVGDVRKCSSWEDTIGRQHALIVLDGVFSFLTDKQTTQSGKTQYM